MPGIFRWPGHIEPGVVDDMAANLDLYATFATLTSGSQPTELNDYISQDLSGVLLRGEQSPRTQWFYTGGVTAFRSGDYKIHLSMKDRAGNPDTRRGEPIDRHAPPLLFDLSSAIGERNNIAAEHPEIVERLLEEMEAFRKRE